LVMFGHSQIIKTHPRSHVGSPYTHQSSDPQTAFPRTKLTNVRAGNSRERGRGTRDPCGHLAKPAANAAARTTCVRTHHTARPSRPPTAADPAKVPCRDARDRHPQREIYVAREVPQSTFLVRASPTARGTATPSLHAPEASVRGIRANASAPCTMVVLHAPVPPALA